MKKLHPCLLLLSLFVFNFSYSQVAINTTGNNANSSAMLDIESTTKGMLIPRMTTTQRTAISSPASGLLVYDNTTSSFWFYNGSAWTELVAGSTTGWKLTGNSGTDTSINFVGTTDNRDLKFRVNNTRVGTLATSGNVFLGFGTGASSTTSILTNGIGAYALNSNTTGNNNNAVGSNALFSNTSGNANNALGTQALYLCTTADLNTAIGHQAMYSNVSGSTNTAVGAGSLSSNTTGHSNVAVGIDALVWNTTRNNLVAVGDSALYNNGAGATNANEAIANTAIGSKALYLNNTGSYNSAIGFNALRSNTTGYQNIATGSEALYQNTTGARNIAIGFRSLLNNSIAVENTAIGDFSMNSNTTGNGNSAYGASSLISNTTGSYNTASGGYTLHQNTTGFANTALGNSSLYYNTTGYQNVSIGENALANNTTGNYNTAIGTSANVLSNNLTNATAIGYRAMAGSSNTLVLGSINGINGANADVNVGIGTTTPTGRLHIKHNSYPFPTILLEETENDFARMQFRNTNANSFWEINANPQTTASNARLEIWNSSSGIAGNLFAITGDGKTIINGPLAPANNTGSSGQVLQSNGNAAPTWVSPTSALYNNISHLGQTSYLVLSGSSSAITDLPGLSYTFSASANTKAMVSFRISVQSNSCFGCGASSFSSLLYVDDVLTYTYDGNVNNNTNFSQMGTAVLNLSPGSHSIKMKAQQLSGPAITVWGTSGGAGGEAIQSYMDVVLINQ
jgi:hypothetical protein